MKKRNYVPSERAIGKIWVWFFEPLLQYSTHETTKDFLKALFNTDRYTLRYYQVKSPYRIKGLYCIPGAKVQGLGHRKLAKGTLLLVRADTKLKTYDVEFAGGRGKKFQVFHLNESEFGELQLHITGE